MKRSRITAGLATVAAAGAMALLPAGAAQATPADCPVEAYGPVCVYIGQSYTGTHTAVTYSGAGRNVTASNGSVVNEATSCLAYLWYNTGESGPELTLAKHGTAGYERAGSAQGTLLNNLRSVSWGC